jgi:hypothetical protein
VVRPGASRVPRQHPGDDISERVVLQPSHRFFELTRQLAAEAAAEAERQFESAVVLFVKKRELTRSLAVARKAPEGPPHAAPAPAGGTQR